jgi:hypothetical protein
MIGMQSTREEVGQAARFELTEIGQVTSLLPDQTAKPVLNVFASPILEA